MDPAQVINHPSGFLALSDRNERFMRDGLPGFVAYRARGRRWIVFGGVHARQDHEAHLLDAFLAAAQAEGRKVLAVQVPRRQVPHFVERGFTVNQLGSTYAVDLESFSLRGTPKMKLRNKISRARRAGVEVVEIRSEVAAHADYFSQLSRVSEEWLADKGKKELDFMIGEVGSGREPQRRTYVVVDGRDLVQAFITYVPTWGDYPGYLHDLSRRRPGAPTGAMELCNVTAIERFREEGVRYLHFGFTPFVTQGPEAPNASRAASWLIQWIRSNGSFLYPTATQLDYKLKWGPDVVQPEYLAARPLSLGAILDLLFVTRSI